MRSTLLLVVVVAAGGCKDQAGNAPPAAAPSAAAPSAAPAAPMVPSPGAPVALSCDEDRFQKWKAFHEESAQVLAGGLQATAEAAKSQPKDSPSAGLGALGGLAATGHAIDALYQKHGITRPEVGQFDSLTGLVADARPLENPMMKGTIDMMKNLSKGSGPMKAEGDKFFAQEEEKGKKAEARARQKFGDACVDLCLKHVADIHAVHMAQMQAVLGPPKKK